MKKFLSIVLTCGMLLGLLYVSACGNGGNSEPEETEPKYEIPFGQAEVKTLTTEWPNYKMAENATVEERRAMAVQAMSDLVNIQWTPNKNFSYKKSGSGSNYDFEFDVRGVYAGIPYTNGDAGIFQWVSAMDMSNGIFWDANFTNINGTQGATCSTTVCWALMTVSSKVKAPWLTYYVVPKNGFVPVGDYKFPENLESYNDVPTDEIVKDNGPEAILEAYAKCLPADAVVSTGSPNTDNHTMMVIEAPKVVRNEDGTIDAEKSTIAIRDQRFVSRKETVNGSTVYYRGRDRADLTFKEILDLNYIPIMAMDFAENTPYEKAEASLVKGATTLDELAKDQVKCNYCVCVAYGRVLDKKGKVIDEVKKTTVGDDIRNGGAFNYKLSSVLPKKLTDKAKATKGSKVQVEVVLATGERFIVSEVEGK